MYHMLHDSPDLQVRKLVDFDGFIGRVFGEELGFFALEVDAFDGKFAIDDHDDDLAVAGPFRAVDDEGIPGVDTGADHAVADHAD